MANPWAGEVSLSVDGQERILKLTLGALAELEGELGEGSVVDLAHRFETGQFSSRDLLSLIIAGLRGGGWQVTKTDLLSADVEGGLAGASKAAAQALARAFYTGDQDDAD